MVTISRLVAGFLAVLIVGAAHMIAAPLTSMQFAPEQDANAAAEFTRRAEAYAGLHRRIEGVVPTVKVSADPWEVRQAMNRLAAAIRKERVDAGPGDVFSPEIAAMFRQRIARLYGDRYDELLTIINEEVEGRVPKPRVNGRWPVQAPFSFFPPDLLHSLPRLPDELEYHFINRDLVLWDVHADLVVDVLINAIPPTT